MTEENSEKLEIPSLEEYAKHLNFIKDHILNILSESEDIKLPWHTCIKMLYLLSGSTILDFAGSDVLLELNCHIPRFHRMVIEAQNAEKRET